MQSVINDIRGRTIQARCCGLQFLRALYELDYSGELVIISSENNPILNAAFNLARLLRLRVLPVLSKPVYALESV